MSRADLLVVAGEASGDLHGASVLAEVQRLEPRVRPFGLGGDELQGLGLDSVGHASEIAVVGISEAVRVLRRARRLYRRLLEEVDQRRPVAALLVDSAEFNLRLAGDLARRGVKVVYFISPQVWAWRRGRVHKIARTVHRMLVLFPFEEEFYRRFGVRAVHVGHPLVDEVAQGPHRWDEPDAGAGPFELALLPGSRRSEITRLLPILLDAARRIGRKLPIRVRLLRAATIDPEFLAPYLCDAGVEVEMVDRDRFQALRQSHLALCASGTATLEVALLGTPMLVVYRVSFWSYLVGRLMVRLPHVSLVNLVLGEGVVPELLQDRATGPQVAAEAVSLLESPDRVRRMRQKLSSLREALGASGASRRAAEQVLEVLDS